MRLWLFLLAHVLSVLTTSIDGSEGDDSFLRLAVGTFSPELFVIKSGSLNLSDGSKVTLDLADTETAMQSITTGGHPEIIEFVDELTRRLHNPPTMGDSSNPGTMSTMLVNGAQDGLYKALESLVDEESIIMASGPTYASFLCCVQPFGCKVQGIKTDSDGIIPEKLAEFLTAYSKSCSLGTENRKLKVLYCVPNGDNPSGIRYTTERKREIYRLAHEYNFLVMEDDPYYFFEKQPRPGSFLSMDTDGRVIRLDSFSKTVGPGFRLGYLSGPKPILSKILIAAQVSTQGCSSWSQMVLLQLLRLWGIGGYLKHCEKVKAFYDQRRDICIKLAEKYFSGLADWVSPTGGMFLWVRFHGMSDTLPLVSERLVKRKVLVIAGAAFYPNGSEPVPCIRISYSIATVQDLEQAFQILAEEVRDMQKIQGVQGR